MNFWISCISFLDTTMMHCHDTTDSIADEISPWVNKSYNTILEHKPSKWYLSRRGWVSSKQSKHALGRGFETGNFQNVYNWKIIFVYTTEFVFFAESHKLQFLEPI